ncbi:MAG: type II toxin-antitoxin system HicB family antitoxin [Alphaproteobacteria bacterium]
MTTFGDDQDDALMHAMDALEEAIASRIADREDIPRPSRGKLRVTLPTQTAMKVLLYQAMAEQGLKKSDLARRLAWHSPQVDRLFDLRHASRVDQMDAAFAAIGRRLEVGVGEVP